MFCKHCGKPMADTAHFCPACGTSASQSSSQQEQAPPNQNSSYQNSSYQAPPKQEPDHGIPPLPHAIDMYFLVGDKSRDTVADFDNRSNELPGLLEQNATYYTQQFREIRTAGRERMNWASFFLSLPHAAYRNMWNIWLGELKLPILATILCSVLSKLSLLSASFLLMALTAFISWGVNIWFLVAQIIFACKFNVMYMHHIDDILTGVAPAPKKATDYNRVWAGLGIYLAMWYLLLLF